MATDFVAAVAKMRGYVGVYLAALAKGPLDAKQAAALETDLKTLDADLVALGAALAAPPKAAAVPTSAPPAAPATGGPLTQAQIDAAYLVFLDAEDVVLKAQGKPFGRDGAPRGALTPDEQIAIATQAGVLRDVTAFGVFGDPGTVPGADYSAYTRYVADENIMRLWVNGKLVAEAPVSTDVLGWANAQAKQYGVSF